MMALDRCGRAFEGDAFDHIRIERPLGQIFHLPNLFRLSFKDGDKLPSDPFPFLLRIRNPFQYLKEGILRVNVG